MNPAEIHFCPRCGSLVSLQVRFGKPRPVCGQCGWVFFADPKVAVAVLVLQNSHVLLVQRLNEPQRGLWSLPGGYLDAGEDPLEAARRECLEETGLVVEIGALLRLDSRPASAAPGAHLILHYSARVERGELAPGDDAQAAQFFALTSLPELAFLTPAGLGELVDLVRHRT